jgi:thiol:disulfide interchange protein DsbA
MKASQPDLASDPANEHPVLQRQKSLLEREPEIRAQFEAELKRVKPGLVYKTYAYWTELLTGNDRGWLPDTDEKKLPLHTIRDTFDGIFFTKGASVSDFPLLYRGFTRAYGRRCRNVLEDPISITITRTETDRYGYEKEEVGKPFIIEKSFYQKFDAYESVEIDYTARTGMRMAMRGASMGSIQESITLHEGTVDKLLSGLSCTSATMRQLRMNLWLRANDRPSLQESGERIPGAEAESQVDVLKSKIDDFETMMADLKSAANRNELYSIIDSPIGIDGEQGIEIAYLYNYYARSNWPFESHIQTWLKQKDAHIRFVRVPAASSSDRISAYGYYAGQNLGMEATIHDAIFEAIYVTRRAPAALTLMRELFEKQEVDASAFDEAIRSSSVKASVAKAEKLHSRYSMTDLPVFLVNGKYEISTATCRCGPEEMLAIVTELARNAD